MESGPKRFTNESPPLDEWVWWWRIVGADPVIERVRRIDVGIWEAETGESYRQMTGFWSRARIELEVIPPPDIP